MSASQSGKPRIVPIDPSPWSAIRYLGLPPATSARPRERSYRATGVARGVDEKDEQTCGRHDEQIDGDIV